MVTAGEGHLKSREVAMSTGISGAWTGTELYASGVKCAVLHDQQIVSTVRWCFGHSLPRHGTTVFEISAFSMIRLQQLSRNKSDYQ